MLASIKYRQHAARSFISLFNSIAMKRIFIILAVFFLISGAAFSQDSNRVNAAQKNPVQKVWGAITNLFSTGDDVLVADSLNENLLSNLKWESLGPNSRQKGSGNTIGIGRLTDIWVDPENNNTILVGSNSGGLWKTIDGGKNWNCITSEVATGGISDIAVDPRSNDVIYITTKATPNGTLKFSGLYSMGVFKTTDGGKTWFKLPIDFKVNEYFERVIIDPESHSDIYVLSNKTVYKSVDWGRTWRNTKLNTPDGVDLKDLELKDQSKTVYASGVNGLYVSTDKGRNWKSVKDNLTGCYKNAQITIATNPANSSELYVLLSDLDNFIWDDTPNRIEKTTDDGETWNLVIDKTLTAYKFTSELALSPNGTIYVGGMIIWRWDELKGKFKSLLSNDIHYDVQDIVFPDPTKNKLVYVVTDGGILMDTTAGNRWAYINGNLSTNEFYSVAINEKHPEVMVGGTHDCGSYYRDSSGVWEYKTGGDGGVCLLDYNDPSIYYTTSNRSFARFEGKKMYPVAQISEYNSPVVMDPKNSDILFSHSWIKGDTPPVHIQKSTDKGATWSTLEQVWKHVTAFDISYSNPNYIYYAMWDPWTTTDVRRTTDGGETWANVNHTDINSICGSTYVSNVFIDPFNPLGVWLIFGGFEKNKKIYYSSNGGDSWKNISGTTLPNVPAQCMQYDYIRRVIYLGTDVGIYFKHIDESEWHYSNGFPHVIVSSMKLNKLNGDLVVSTYGRGIWRTNLGEGFCQSNETVEIDGDVEWSENIEVCSDIVVKTGSKLTIKSNVMMPFSSSIVIQPNATLVVDSAKVVTGHIIVEEGAQSDMLNGGTITEIYSE